MKGQSKTTSTSRCGSKTNPTINMRVPNASILINRLLTLIDHTTPLSYLLELRCLGKPDGLQEDPYGVCCVHRHLPAHQWCRNLCTPIEY